MFSINLIWPHELQAGSKIRQRPEPSFSLAILGALICPAKSFARSPFMMFQRCLL